MFSTTKNWNYELFFLFPVIPHRKVEDRKRSVIIKATAYYAVLQIKYVPYLCELKWGALARGQSVSPYG